VAARADEKHARTCTCLMAIRNRLENYVVRSTTELLGELPENRQSELGELLAELEGRGESFVEAETRIEELLARLEQRSTAVTALEAEVSELKTRIARLKHELEERERLGNERLEAERVRAAERENKFREELETLAQRRTPEPQGTWFGAQVQNNPRPLSA
jgi:peptidoglycan hydrolase CwlO-like protein